MRAENIEQFLARHKDTENSDDFTARILLDWLWPTALCTPDVVWNVRRHIQDREYEESRDDS